MKKLTWFILSIFTTLALCMPSSAFNRVQLAPEYFPNPISSKALSNADIYVGVVDLDPEILANRKQVSVLQENGTIVAVSQPIKTGLGGTPVYNGSPVTMLVEGSYSLKVVNSYGAQVYYVPSSSANDQLDSVANVAGLRALGYTPSDGAIAVLLGHTTDNDGGGGTFYYDASSVLAENNGTVILQAGHIGAGRWIRQLNGFITPEMFGGDIQSCLDIGGRIIANGAYTVTDQLEITVENTEITGNGSIIYTGSMVADNMFYAVSVDGIKISGLRLIGDHTNQGTDTTASAIYLEDCDDFIIENNDISEFSRLGIIIRGGADFLVYKNRIHDIKYGTSLDSGYAITVRNIATNYKIKDNIIFNIGTNAYGGAGIGIGYYNVATGISTGFTVSGNSITDVMEHGIVVYNGVTNNEDLENADISNNIIKNTGLSTVKARGNGIYIINCGGASVTNNQLYATNTNTPTTTIVQAAIAIAGYDETTHQPINVIGNKIDDTGLHSGIFIQKMANFACNSNTILNGKTKRQLVFYRCVDFTCSGNMLDVADGITAISFGGDSALLPCKNGSVSNNTIKGSLYGLNCVFGENLTMSNNVITGNTDTAILITTSVDCFLSGNITDVAAQHSLSIQGSTNVTAENNHFVRYTAVTWPRVSIGTSTGCYVIDWCTTTPTPAAWDVGCYLRNRASTVGQPKGWYCTTPGTWVSEGNL